MRLFTIISFLLVIPVSSFALPFNMQDAPLKDFVNWISDATGKNIIVAPGVDTVLNLKVRNIEDDDVWPFFVSCLEAQGLTVTEKDLFHLVTKTPLTVVQPGDSLPVVGDPGSGHVVPLPGEPTTGKLYKVLNVLYASIDKALQSVSPGSSFSAVPGTQFFYLVATQDEHDKIETLLPALDIRSPRVLVEAVVMEVAQNKSQEVGVSVSAVLDNARLLATSTFASPSLPGAVASYTRTDFRAVVSALNGLDHLKLLSSPSILVSPGSKGSVVVGQNVPFVTGSYSDSSDGGDQPFQTIERQDVGLTLSVFPLVISSNLIDLVIGQEVSTVSSDDIASDIITDKRSITTRLTLTPGEWISLGGLVNEVTDESSVGVPGLMNIPFLGRAFRIDRSSQVKRDLSVLLRVTLV